MAPHHPTADIERPDRHDEPAGATSWPAAYDADWWDASSSTFDITITLAAQAVAGAGEAGSTRPEC